MALFRYAVWFCGDALLVCLLVRAWRASLFRRYPHFFGYLISVAGSELLRVYLRAVASERHYQIGYWVSEFLLAIAGFGVTWQIYTTILAPYRGVRRMAHTVLGVLFAVVLAKALVELTTNPIHNLIPTTVELEWNLRFLQALLLLAIAALVVHYAVPIGRNTRAMLVGYGFYIGCMVISLSLRSQLGAAFDATRILLEPLGYLTTLFVWCAGIWSYSRNPVPNILIETDYHRISEQTSRAFGRLRTHVTHSWRP